MNIYGVSIKLLILMIILIFVPWWGIFTILILLPIIFILYISSAKENENFEVDESKRADFALDKIRKLPTINRVLASSSYTYMENELLSIVQEARSIVILKSNISSEASDIQDMMDSITKLESANAQARGNATAFAPLVGKTPNVIETNSKDYLQELLVKKSEIRQELINKINIYNNQLDELKSWRSKPFLSWYLTKLNYPDIEHFPLSFSSNL
ncbi:hypothetical protein [Pseudoalteromonas sp. SG45-2]|uniref:hypothetical protein n=1 Tax=Pseudoalteromonas sp. SG45-2 TaxID=2760956 RepID=UPI001600DDCB|nr:hypothetical protein [Pseudoalteromonas sp. SG45-2]MBB1347174.1 hypothetical protein [Pseudoalteromonas sp. SG45-2]